MIPSQFLSAYVPLSPAQFGAPVLAGDQLTITWTGAGILLESTDLKTWTPVAGNPTSPYTVNIAGAPLKFYTVMRN